MLAFPKYESYQNSDISWIQELPGTWKIERAKWLFKKMERPVRPEDEVVTAFRDGQVTLRRNRREEGFTNAIQEHGYQGIRKNDLVIHAMDAFAGAIGVSDSDDKSTPVYSACVPRGEFYVNNYYYAYLIRYMAKSGFIQSLSKGIRERSTDFRFNDFANLCLPIPSKEEQDRIVEFLDRTTTDINRVIAQKQRLIELLQEQKAILINQAVTKGLNPNVPMRDSGIDAIGEIPDHWFLAKLKFVSKNIGDGIHATPEYVDSSDYYFVNGNNLVQGKICITESTRCVSERELKKHKIELDTDTILISINGTIGNVAFYQGESVILGKSAAYIKGIKVEKVHKYFLGYFLISSSARRYFFDEVTGSTIYNLSLSSLMNTSIPIPPIEEQVEIISFLDNALSRVTEMEQNIRSSINTIQEWRNILIANAVAGKIKT